MKRRYETPRLRSVKLRPEPFVVSPEEYDRIVRLIGNPGEPPPALIKLMRGKR